MQMYNDLVEHLAYESIRLVKLSPLIIILLTGVTNHRHNRGQMRRHGIELGVVVAGPL